MKLEKTLKSLQKGCDVRCDVTMERFQRKPTHECTPVCGLRRKKIEALACTCKFGLKGCEVRCDAAMKRFQRKPPIACTLAWGFALEKKLEGVRGIVES